MNTLLVIIVIVAILWVIKTYFRGIKIFNIANNIILAAITYERMTDKEKLEADRYVSELLAVNPRLQETLASLSENGREAVKWRWYSLAFAYNHIPPSYQGKKLGWTPSKNVYRDTTAVHRGISRFAEHLKNREVFEKYIWWLEIK